MRSFKKGLITLLPKCLKDRLGLSYDPYSESRVIPVGPLSRSKLDARSLKNLRIYGNNEIRTSRYKWYSFVFHNLYEQTQRIANFYFICIAVIQLFIETPVSPASSILPLLFVIFLTMIKQGYEDYLRHKADREINNRPIEVIDESGVLITKKSYELVVGDIILICNGDTLPCDIVILSSNESSGECYVTTASLDGETNLKRFYAPPATRELDSPSNFVEKLDATIICQQPVPDIYEFFGKIIVTDPKTGDETTLPLNNECLLLRGACLKNTDFVYGCVVYTGNDTKMSLNAKRKQNKFSQIERKLNGFLLVYFVGLIFVCSSFTLFKYLLTTDAWYISVREIKTWYIVQDLFAFIVLFNYAIPISLYVTIEFQKFFGSQFFGWDMELYDSEIDERALANTSDIPEEMGQVEYLFSDKTGTLTKNEMSFQRLAIAEGTYLLRDAMLHPLFEVKVKKMRDLRTPRYSGVGLPSTQMPKNAQILLIFLALCHTVRVEQDPDTREAVMISLMPLKKRDPLGKRVRDGLKKLRPSKIQPPSKEWTSRRRESAILSAQEAVSAVNRGSTVKSFQDYEYQASSPDEKTFLEGCRDLGIIYHGENKQQLQVVTVFGKKGLQYRLLDVLEFDSNRKCMSVIIQPVLKGEPETPEYIPEKPALVLCKGADSSILEKSASMEDLPSFQGKTGDPLIDGLFVFTEPTQKRAVISSEKVIANVGQFASFGLRTLVEGVRLLKPGEWTSLRKKLNEARSQMADRTAALAKAYGKIERDLMLIGCTGVEDQLQDGVPETLTALREAGIQTWVLTGDKEETAMNVSFLSGHFAPGLSIIRVTKKTNPLECSTALDNELNNLKLKPQEHGRTKYGLVVDGQTLNFALNVIQKNRFLELCGYTEAVLCCRLTPMQKAEVVRLIKQSRSPSPVTCAIGDGANDVPMIIEANVGIGLFGKEGRQAARASDYALGKFRFLRRALLFHGFNFYWRSANVVLYFFYKNLVFVLTQAYFSFYSQFSTQTVFSSIYLLSYNMIMTSSPIVVYGIMEMRYPETFLLSIPMIYKSISRNSFLSWRNFAIWNIFGLWHSIVLFYGCYVLAGEGVSKPGGALETLSGFGSMLFSLIFIVVTVKLLLNSYSFNILVFFTIVATVLITYLIFAFINFVAIPMGDVRDLTETWGNLFCGASALTSLFGHIGIPVLAVVPDVIHRWLLDSRDFVHDSGYCSGRKKSVNLKDEPTRKSLLSKFSFKNNEMRV